jgi:hypothetical protein
VSRFIPGVDVCDDLDATEALLGAFSTLSLL